MVSSRYLLAKPAGPSKVQRLFNQRVLPPAIDAAAQVEAVMERVGQAARRSPFTALGVAFGVGALGAVLARKAGKKTLVFSPKTDRI